MKLKIIKPKMTNKYNMPTLVYFGRGAVVRLLDIIKKNKSKNILFVIDEHIKNKNLTANFTAKRLGNISVTYYKPRIVKSDYKTINKLTENCREHNFDTIIAVGGGSVLDTAKCAAILSKNKGVIQDYTEKKTRAAIKKGICFIAVPTTAGTGSEVTPWATVWGDNKRKYSFASPKIFPKIAIVDPAFTDTLPKKITAESGIDALCQAIESYWNVNHNLVSDRYALKAIRIILKNLKQAVNDPNRVVRDAMAMASLMSGLAFSNTKTTVCHSISYPITAHWSIAHGQAVSLTLPAFIEYTLPVLRISRKKRLLKALDAENEIIAANKIKTLMADIHLKTRISELKIPRSGLKIIIAEGFNPDRVKNAPRVPSSKELEIILNKIY